jgi:hypothetical protein
MSLIALKAMMYFGEAPWAYGMQRSDLDMSVPIDKPLSHFDTPYSAAIDIIKFKELHAIILPVSWRMKVA